MLNQRLSAAHDVRDAFVPLKKECAALAVQAARCAAVLAEARVAAGLPIGTGAAPIAKVQRAAALIQAAETELAAAHPELGALIEETGLSRHYVFGMYGQDETPPPEERRNRGALTQAA